MRAGERITMKCWKLDGQKMGSPMGSLLKKEGAVCN